MSELAELQDFRRDAVSVLYTEIAQHILDLAREDLPTEDEIHLLRDDSDDEKWSGIFQVETNLEKIFEVTYRHDTQKFYVTTYLMAYCNIHEPPHEY